MFEYLKGDLLRIDGEHASMTTFRAYSKRHVATVFAQVATRPSQRANLQQVQAVNATTVTERYCPARRAFLRASSPAEFQRRAAAHCRDQPPTGQGLSGAQVTLTAECQQVYAIVCP